MRVILEKDIELVKNSIADNKINSTISIIKQYNPRAQTEDGFCFIHIISNMGNITVLDYLIKHKYLDPHQPDLYGYRALHFAAKFNQLNILRYLVEECDASIEIKTNSGQTPLMCAVINSSSDLALIRYLVEDARADLSATLPSGIGFAQFLESHKNPEISTYLKSKLMYRGSKE